jgi:hypothetical protein
VTILEHEACQGFLVLDRAHRWGWDLGFHRFLSVFQGPIAVGSRSG